MATGSNAAVIGSSVKLRGELSGTEDLEFNGEVKGSINLTDARLVIGPNGKVVGDISAKDVVVLGNVDGTIRAVERADLRASAVIKGQVSAARLQIEPGAELHVKVTQTQAKAEPVAAAPAPVETKAETGTLFRAESDTQEASKATQAKQAKPKE